MRLSDDDDLPTVQAQPCFDSFYREEYASLLGLAITLSGNRWASEDLVQEALLRAHRDWASVADYAGPWVRRVLINLAMSRFRRLRVEARGLVKLPTRTSVPALTEPTDDFWNEVRRLPRRQAQVIALYYLEDAPIRQIAEVLGIKDNAVKAALFKGRKSLANKLQPGRQS